MTSLVFTPDSGRLLVGGEDKLVHVWILQEAGGKVRGTVSRRLHWEFARGLRGAVFAMAVSKKDDEVAIGGYSARDLGGVISVLDAGDATVDRSLPDWDDEAFLGDGHRGSVISLDYNPSGSRLASVAKNGEVFVWSAPDWKPNRVRAAGGGEETYQPAIFLDDGTLVVSERIPGRRNWGLVLHRIVDGQPVRDAVLGGHTGRITSMTRAPAGDLWASADDSGRIIVWKGARRPTPRVLRNSGRIALDLALGPDGRLAAACRQDARGDAILELWDTTANRLEDSLRTSQRNPCRACAISPDGNWLATHSPDSHAVFVYALQENGARIAKPFSGQPTVLRGRGRSIWKVAFAKDGSKRIGIGRTRAAKPEPNDFGDVDSIFDLEGMRFSEELPEDVEWRLPTDGSDDWVASIDATETRINLRRGARPAAIELDRVQQGRATCFCFLPDPTGKPFAIAVGTSEQHGIYVYRLPEANERPALLRYYRDHNGPVRSLTVSGDGKLLASGSEDQLLKVWSLSGLEQKSPTFSKAAAWGASFVVNGGKLVVEKTNPAGIAVGRNLANGDVLERVRTARGEEREPARMLAALDALPLFQTAVLDVRRGDEKLPPILLVPAWEPIVTLFVDERGEWALFTPRGDYDASVAEGNELFGWQVNRGPDVTPRIFAAAELQQEFEKPDVIRQLLSGVVPQEAADAGRLAAIMQGVPELELLEPRTGTVAQEGVPVPVAARLRFVDAAQQARFAVRGFVNGIPLGQPKVTVDGLVALYEWAAVAPDPTSVFTVFVEDRDGGADALMKRDTVAIRAEAAPPRYQLNVLTLAVNAYDQNAKNFLPLRFAVGDAKNVLERFESGTGTFYDMASVKTLFDEQVSRDGVSKQIETILDGGNLDGDDLLVVFLSGHGYAHGSSYYFIPGSVDSTDPAVLEKNAIPWHVLRRLSELPCRKLILLDTCYAGNAALKTGEDRALAKAATQPFRRHGFLVVAATDVDQSAKEGPNYDNHGAFTFALLRGLDGEADGWSDGRTDGDVSLHELAAFTRSKVADLTFDAQRPVYTPFDRFREIDPLKLIRSPREPLDLPGQP